MGEMNHPSVGVADLTNAQKTMPHATSQEEKGVRKKEMGIQHWAYAREGEPRKNSGDMQSE
jgi:hypothetical protein